VRALAVLVATAVVLSGCSPFSRDLRDPQTGMTATCTHWLPIYGDWYAFPVDGPYCRCINGHLAEGYLLVGQAWFTGCGPQPESN